MKIGEKANPITSKELSLVLRSGGVASITDIGTGMTILVTRKRHLSVSLQEMEEELKLKKVVEVLLQ